jgi:hypothetical protein
MPELAVHATVWHSNQTRIVEREARSGHPVRVDTSQRELAGKSVLLDSPELVTHPLRDGQVDLLRLVQQWPKSPPPEVTVRRDIVRSITAGTITINYSAQ